MSEKLSEAITTEETEKMGRFTKFFFGGLIDRVIKPHVDKLNNAEVRFAAAERDSDQNYRRITQKSVRDLTPMKQSKMIRICDHLYKRNPLAKRFIDILKGFIIGKGSKAECPVDKSQEIIDDFRDRNKWKITEGKRTRETSVFGEWCAPVWVEAHTGRIRLGYIDPDNIDGIKTDPLNNEIITAVILKSKRDGKKIVLPGIVEQTSQGEEHFGKLIGDQTKVGSKEPVGCFYFRINDLSNQHRGLSDLLSGADWFDALDTLIFNIADREGYLNAFIWDIKVEGALKPELMLRRKEIKLNPPKSGACMVHNEKETWSAIPSGIQAKDSSKSAELIMMMIVAATGMPEHWLGQGGNVNRATALEMADPTLKMIGERQEFLRQAFTIIHTFALDQAMIAGYKIATTKEDQIKENRTVEVTLPELSEEDAKSVSEALLSLTNSLVTALSADLVELENASKVFAHQVSKLGVKIDPPKSGSIKDKADGLESIANAKKKLDAELLKAKETALKRKTAVAG